MEKRTPREIADDLKAQAAEAEANCTPLATCKVVGLTVEFMDATAAAMDWVKNAIQHPPA